ncbi:CopG family ribbon-helix-helix protein [Zavarzinia compransoris]|uniref:CopG family transcriptional regulator n=1 Tax=Zavarzinia compransoris TaxID=1264899 RepID=A0A317EB38_9PROT|nr:CopG family transcriptional regulator [Zavarzinia compransoris]PWR23762.1 CopG family transcriptional regulator [Zavarzinia compransoris]TDP47991.1 putative transcriptional regulator [Zavarzinia compransoris]
MATSVRIDGQLEARLQRLAQAKAQSTDELLIAALQQFIEREEARQDFVGEALQSLAAFQRDGLHLTGAETRDWLKQWGAGRGEAPPDCHE